MTVYEAALQLQSDLIAKGGQFPAIGRGRIGFGIKNLNVRLTILEAERFLIESNRQRVKTKAQRLREFKRLKQSSPTKERRKILIAAPLGQIWHIAIMQERLGI